MSYHKTPRSSQPTHRSATTSDNTTPIITAPKVTDSSLEPSFFSSVTEPYASEVTSLDKTRERSDEVRVESSREGERGEREVTHTTKMPEREGEMKTSIVEVIDKMEMDLIY